jgi:tight adherence protein C
VSATDRVRGVLVVATGLAGALMLVSALTGRRRPRLAARVVPYLRDPQGSSTGAAAVATTLVAELAARLQRVLGGERDLERELDRAGWPGSAADFRAEQVTWGLVGLALGALLASVLAAGSGTVSALGVLGCCLGGAAGGLVARRWRLDRQVAARQRAAAAEVPVFVDLVCVAVTAGESLRAALEVAAVTTGGPVAEAVTAAMADTRAGQGLGEALGRRADGLGAASFRRFVEAVVVAQERGVPPADALRALALDSREAGRRAVLEAAGRKEVTMLIPVVGLILPVAILFAFFPGVVAVRTLVR